MGPAPQEAAARRTGTQENKGKNAEDRSRSPKPGPTMPSLASASVASMHRRLATLEEKIDKAAGMEAKIEELTRMMTMMCANMRQNTAPVAVEAPAGLQ